MKQTILLNLRAWCLGLLSCSLVSLCASTGTQTPVLTWTTSDFNGQMISCAGATDGSIDLTVTGAALPYTVSWFGPGGFLSSSEDIANLAAGDYEVTVVDANLDSASVSILLLSADPISVSAVVSDQNGYNVSCFGGNDGAIDITVTGGTSPFTYQWTGPNGITASSEDLTNLVAGNYSILLTDVNGCSANKSFALTQPDANQTNPNVSTFIGGYNVSCATASDGKVDLSPSGGVSPHAFNWQGPNGFANTNAHLVGILAGEYTLVMTDANGCAIHDTISVDAPSPLNVNLTGPAMINGHHFICAEDSSANILTTVNGGVPFYSFNWSGPSGMTYTTANLTDVPAGSYNVQVADTNNCVTNASITLTQPDPITVNAVFSYHGGYQVSCNGSDGSIDLTVSGGTGGYSYFWTNTNAQTFTTEDLNGLEAGTYTLSITDASGCVYMEDFALTQTPLLDLTFNVSDHNGHAISCFGVDDGTIDLTIDQAAAPLAVSWNGPNGFSSSSNNISGLAPGQYTFSISDANSCSWDTLFNITAPAELTASLSAPSINGFHIDCAGANTGSIAATISGGVTPVSSSWNGPNGFSSTALNIDNLLSGLYTLTSVDANGCQHSTQITLLEPTTLATSFATSSFSTGHEVSCAGSADGNIDLSISGGSAPFAITWTFPNGATDTNEDIAGLTAGTYDLLIRDALGCEVSSSVTLTAPAAISAASVVTSQYAGGFQLSCSNSSDGSIAPVFTGGTAPYAVSWTGPNGFASSTSSINNVAAGVYSYLVTDANGCSFVDSTTLSAPAVINASLTASTFAGGVNISCAGMDDGTLTSTPTGGAGAYTFNWSGPNGFTSTAAQLTDLAPGNYCVMVTDQNSCTNMDCFLITEPTEIDLSSAISNATCGQAVGGIDLNVIGGSAPYDYSWSNGASTQDLAGLNIGTFTVSISDANGCTALHTATVMGSTGVSAGSNTTDVSCAFGTDGSIDLTVLSGNAPYTFDWSNGATSQDITALQAGNYSVTITDSQGCATTESINIDEPSPILIDLILSDHNGFNVSQFGASDGTASASISGGIAPYIINWSTGDQATSISDLSPNTYSVEVTDAQGCVAILEFDIEQPFDLVMPNGFSPNSDGYNDVFIVQGIELHPNNEFTVLNRWGDVVYNRSDYQNDWSGENNNGQALTDGTYFVVFIAADAQIELTGYVELRR